MRHHGYTSPKGTEFVISEPTQGTERAMSGMEKLLWEYAQAYRNLIGKLEAIEVDYSPITGTFDNIEGLLNHLAELEEKKLVQCPNCDEQFFVDEDGGIDAFIGA